MKKFLSILLTLVTLFGVMSVFTVPASAVSTTAFDVLTSSKYAKVYTLSSSGKTIPYTNTKLTTRGSITYGESSTAYIDNKADELYLYDVGKNSKGVYWAKISYPIGSKRAFAYIPLSAIIENNGTHFETTATGKFYCSYRKGVSTSSSYYVANGDTVYLIATSGSNYQILYPISGDKWRIGWCSKTDYNKYCTPTPVNPNNLNCNTSAKFITPMKSYRMTNAFGNYCSFMSNRIYNGKTRAYHLGIDYCSVPDGDKNIYAFASGVVVKSDWNDANGYYVIIQHTISNKTVYSFYGHLKSYCVSQNEKVSAGEKIGVVGQTGSSGNGVDHLHFAVTDQLWSGSYWGYGTMFSGNKTFFDDVTYYNPDYIIKNGKLPA